MPVKISDDTNYWLVRTYGGRYYSEFVQQGYVAIGWNDISDLDLIKLAASDSKAQEQIYSMSQILQQSEGKDDGQPGRIANPILRFVNEMKIGDVVIIPSVDSERVQFGVITSDAYVEKNKSILADEGNIPLFKRRNVNWSEWRDRNTLDPFLYRLFNSHGAVNSANDYAEYINRTLYGYYVKGDKAHLVFNVKKQDGILGVELVNLIHGILNSVDVLNEGDQADSNDIEVKLTLNSPGLIEFSGGIEKIGIAAFVISVVIGGRVKIDSFEFETPGLLEKARLFLKDYYNYKLENKRIDNLQRSMDTLQVDMPRELVAAATDEEDQGN